MLISAAGRAVAGDDADVVLGAGVDGGEVADAQAVADDDVRDVVRRMRLGRRDDEILLVVLAASGRPR